MSGPVVIPSSCGMGYYTADGRPWLKFGIAEGLASPMGYHEVYLEGLRLKPWHDYVLSLHTLEVSPDAGKGALRPGQAGLLRLVCLEGAKETKVARWPFVAPKAMKTPLPRCGHCGEELGAVDGARCVCVTTDCPAAGGYVERGERAPSPICRVCGSVPLPAPSMGGPDICRVCGSAPLSQDGMSTLVRERARLREEDNFGFGFGFLLPPRARPLRSSVLARLKVMLNQAQDGDRVEEAQALCVAIECIEQLPRLMDRPKPYRRGANWTPPAGEERCFFGQDEVCEVCALCGKHIRDHYGLTEYRCDPT